MRILDPDVECHLLSFNQLLVVLPWPKKLRQARKPNIGACMLDRSRACATCVRLSQFFLARVVFAISY